MLNTLFDGDGCIRDPLVHRNPLGLLELVCGREADTMEGKEDQSGREKH